jgi:hypothetical protein
MTPTHAYQSESFLEASFLLVVMTCFPRLAAAFAVFALSVCSIVRADETLQQVFSDPHGVDVKISPQGPALKDVL